MNLIASIFGGVLNNGFLATCFHGELFAGPGPMIILLAEAILQMRVYALYGRNKKMLIFFILLNVALFGFNVLQFSNLFLYAESGGCPDGGCFEKRDLVRRGFIPDDPEVRLGCSLTVQITGVAWGVTSFLEFILFVLVFVKAQAWKICIRKKGTTGDGAPRVRDIITTMARDSISYFAILADYSNTLRRIFTICLFTSFCTSFYMTYYSRFFYFMYIESNALETIVITIMTILAPKLILNLRAEYYGLNQTDQVELTWNVAGLDELTSRRPEHSNHSEALASFLD
ncbi:hypothetical protein ACEPAH_9015 [Sanghuangporus vaninii]